MSSDRVLDNPINWSFRVGRIWDVNIRVHVAFVLCAVFLVWMEIPPPGTEWHRSLPRLLVDSLGTYAILFAIVLLHEFGHCYGARRTGGQADEILLWPLGGLAYVNPPHQPRAHMFTTLAGPTVNVIICALFSTMIISWCGTLGAIPWNPLHPYQPIDSTIRITPLLEWLLRVYGISYFLLLVNLLPIFPFDGGRILQAWLWPVKGFHASMLIATGTGMVGAIVVGLFALFTAQDWLLMMIAVFGYMTCWQTRRLLREQGEYSTENIGQGLFSQSYSFFEKDQRVRKPGFWQRWRARKNAEKLEQDRKQREDHAKAVEDILRKVSQTGLDSLSPRERTILEQETERRRSVPP